MGTEGRIGLSGISEEGIRLPVIRNKSQTDLSARAPLLFFPASIMTIPV